MITGYHLSVEPSNWPNKMTNSRNYTACTRARASVSTAADKEEQLLSGTSHQIWLEDAKSTRHMPPLSSTCCSFVFHERRFPENSDKRWKSRLTLSCVFASFCMLSNVYFSDLLWRILKRREPLLDCRDNSSSMMSLGMLSFFPRSIKSPVQIKKNKKHSYVFIQQKRKKISVSVFVICIIIFPIL